MQEIKKICERCGKIENITKTMENPNPPSTIKLVKIAGRGKEFEGLSVDLCHECHRFIIHDTERRLRGEITIPEAIERATKPDE